MTHLPPPVIYLGFLALGWIANLYYQIPISSTRTTAVLILGLGIIAIGLALGSLALLAMKRAKVSPLPWQSPARLVVDGPFRYSRNPIYLSTALDYLGISVILNTYWPVIFLTFALTIVDRLVIMDEERFLEEKFGEEYRGYKARVRRWI